MRWVCAVGCLCFALATSTAFANQIYPTRCDGIANPADRFAPTDTVCVAGDVDYTCPSGPISIPAADVYVVPTGDEPLNAMPVHFETLGGFGGFWDIQVVLPPLPCGSFDILLDERCDGVITGEDILVSMAFQVSGAGCPADAGVSDAGASDATINDAMVPDSSVDAALMDAAPDAMADAAPSTPDASVETSTPDASAGSTSDSGCGCIAVGARPSDTIVWLAAVFLWGLRRRARLKVWRGLRLGPRRDHRAVPENARAEARSVPPPGR